MGNSDCLFCRIIRGEIKSFTILETELILGFMDINPANPGHVLVIPKEHAADIFSLSAQSLTAVALSAKNIAQALREEISPAGLNLVQANGKGAAQSVMHFHMHVLPRTENDALALNWPLIPGDPDSISTLAKQLRARL